MCFYSFVSFYFPPPPSGFPALYLTIFLSINSVDYFFLFVILLFLLYLFSIKLLSFALHFFVHFLFIYKFGFVFLCCCPVYLFLFYQTLSKFAIRIIAIILFTVVCLLSENLWFCLYSSSEWKCPCFVWLPLIWQ